MQVQECYYSLSDDIGFIRLVDVMPRELGGGDVAIVQAARVSYGPGTKTVSEDTALIRYLMRHQHMSPFEMVEFKFHIRCPLFVARQWLRHRTANVNEMSARYSVMEDRFYIPHNIRKQSLINKQGSSTDVLSAEVADTFIKDVEMVSKLSYQKYTDAVAAGIARELARILLPVNIYTEFYWKIDLRNLLHFIELRADPHAQYEIRRYAEDMTLLIEPYVPAAIQAFRDYVLNSVTLSSIEVRALEVEHASIAPPLLHKASKTEIAEWEAKFRRLNPSQI